MAKTADKATSSMKAAPSTPTATEASAAATGGGGGRGSGGGGTSRGRPAGGRSRRSTRVKDHDPIVADGFGTSKDLQKLSSDLSLSLPAVQAMMGAKGRGITSTRRREAEGAAAASASGDHPTAASSAWADFIQEEGTGELATGEPSSSIENKSEDKKKAEDEVKLPPIAAASLASSHQQQLQERNYDLSVLQKQNKTAPPAFKKAKQQPQHQSILLQTGTLDWMAVGRNKRSFSQYYDLSVPTCMSFPKVTITTLVTSCSAVHSLAISSQGQVYGWGRNECSQLTSTLPEVVVLPTLLDIGTVLSDQHHAIIVGGAVGKSHTVLLTNHGDAYAVGSNKSGQCGVSQGNEVVPKFKKCLVVTGTATSMVQVSCGEDFTVTLDEEGCLYSTGSSEFGQLGNGETGQYFVTASKLAFTNCYALTPRTVACHVVNEKCHSSCATDYKVVPLPHQVRFGNISCGKHHTLAVEAPSEQALPRVFSWGCGDYGCLGHGVQKDEYYPRLVASLGMTAMVGLSNPPVRAAAGSACSLLLTQLGHVYYWGRHRSVGEAVMRPQLVDALANNGHVVTTCGAGHQTVICSTQAAVTVAWGQGTYGELGIGQAKSSSKPQFVKSLQDVPVAQVACGYGHTLFLVQQKDMDEEEEHVQKAVSALPILDEDQVSPLLGKVGRSGTGEGKKSSKASSGSGKKGAKKR